MNMRITMDAKKYEQLGKGLVRRHSKGKLYGAYSPSKNIIKPENRVPLDPKKDVIWCLDHNNHPQSSVIVQEYPRNEPALITVVDEMILWGADAEEVGNQFVKRYKPFNLQGNVLIYGDPSMFNGKIEGKVDHKFAIIQGVLEDAGFRVILLARPTRYFIADRLAAVNRMLEDGMGTVRLKVNDHCEHIKLGLSFLQWHKNGKAQDDSVDDKARASGNYDRPHVMTHPMDALGYYIVEKYPILEAYQEHPYILSTATGSSIQLDKDGNVNVEKVATEEADFDTLEDSSDPEDDLFDEAEEEFEEEMKYERKHGELGIAQTFRRQGLWRPKPS